VTTTVHQDRTNGEEDGTVIKFDIMNRFSGDVQFTAEIDCLEDASRSYKIGLSVKWAIKSGADLYRADLSGANLYRAILSEADLSEADLSGAILSEADLYGAILSEANLYGANLYGANLYGANLYRANLSEANLSEANLSGADLSGANLYGANLYGANLSEANLSEANLSGAEGADLVIARSRILPDGDIIGWKKCRDDVIVKLRIPAEAKRSHAFGRKCRAEFADVLEVIGADKAISLHDRATVYASGERIVPDSFDENWQEECSSGIHFFITRAEAEAYA